MKKGEEVSIKCSKESKIHTNFRGFPKSKHLDAAITQTHSNSTLRISIQEYFFDKHADGGTVLEPSGSKSERLGLGDFDSG